MLRFWIRENCIYTWIDGFSILPAVSWVSSIKTIHYTVFIWNYSTNDTLRDEVHPEEPGELQMMLTAWKKAKTLMFLYSSSSENSPLFSRRGRRCFTSLELELFLPPSSSFVFWGWVPPSRGSVCDSAVAAAVRMMMRKKRDLYLGIQGMWCRFVFKSCLSDHW